MIDRRRWQIAFLQQARSDYTLEEFEKLFLG